MILRMLGSFGRFVVHVLGVGKPLPTSLALMTGAESCAGAQEPLLRRAMKAASVPEPALDVVAVEPEAGAPVLEAEIIETAPDDAAVPLDEDAPSILDEPAPEPEVLAAPVEEAEIAPEIACDEPCAAADFIEIEPVVEAEVEDATGPVVEDEALPVEAAPVEAAPGKKAKAKKAAAKKAPKKRAAGKRRAAEPDAAAEVAGDATVTDDPDDDGVPVDISAPFETRIETPAH